MSLRDTSTVARTWWLSIVTVLLALMSVGSAFPSFASAAFTTSFTVDQSTTTAAAHPNLTATYNLPGSPDLKTLTTILPQGLHIAPGAVASPCSLATAAAGNCAASTKVGTVTAAALGSLTATGTLYLTSPPTPSDAAGLSIKLAVSGGRGNLIAQGSFDLNNIGVNQPNQRIVFSNFPTATKFGFPVHFTQLRLVLASSFVTNPSTCPSPASSVTVNAVATDGSIAQATASYPTTGCDTLPFSAGFSQSLSNPNAGQATNATYTVDVPAGSSSIGIFDVTLPPFLSLNLLAFGSAPNRCPAANLSGTALAPTFTASGCPAQAKIGTVSIKTPLAAAPLTGNIYVVSHSPLIGLGLSAKLGGVTFNQGVFLKAQYVDPSCDVSVEFCEQQFVLDLPGLPEAPISQLSIAFGTAPWAGSGGSTLSGQIFLVAQPGAPECVVARGTHALVLPYVSWTRTVQFDRPTTIAGC
ncbi:MAG: hypothetical protein ACRDKI_04685 [Solirubrobacterales bacterium]